MMIEELARGYRLDFTSFVARDLSKQTEWLMSSRFLFAPSSRMKTKTVSPSDLHPARSHDDLVEPIEEVLTNLIFNPSKQKCFRMMEIGKQ